MPTLRTLVGQGCAVVVRLPVGFDLSDALRSARDIGLATAFAHSSGWRYLKTGIVGSSADVFLLTGTECNYTEPRVLREWLQLKLARSDKVNVNLASSTPFFHPKVLIVRATQMEFAVVGSGNLSNGGLHGNCECSVYIDDASTVSDLCGWFDSQFKAAQDARRLGLDPDRLITSAFVGVAVLSEVRSHTRADARLLKKRRAGFGWFPGNFSWGLEEPLSHFASQSQGTA